MPPTRPPLASPSQEASRLPSVGEQFDKYTLLAKLATGGMAELFVARLTGAAGFSKNVVIKRILPQVAHDEHFTRMFLDEAITCAQINHPNVCQVFELCEAQEAHFLVLEHLEGATVGDLIRRSLMAEQQLNLRLAAGIIVQACDGLHAAHEQTDADDRNIGLVHRDVSPGNLFVTVDGIVKVLDFGIAKARWMSRKTRTGTLLGKCEYMSPEQARGGVPLDRRSDIFSLGIAAWELVCGQRLFRRETEYETLKAVLRSPIEPPRSLRPGVPEALDDAIMRALERDPSDRWRSAYEFRQAIADSLRSTGGPTPMCDIAPVIRKSFAEDLKIQRAILKQASQELDSKSVGPKLHSIPQISDEIEANTGALTGERVRLPSLESEDLEEESRELTFRVIPRSPPDLGERATEPSFEPPSAANFKRPWTGDPDIVDFQKQNAAPRAEVLPPDEELTPKEIPRSAPLAAHDPVGAPHSGTPVREDQPSSWRPTGLLLAMALLTSAAVATLTLLYIGQDQASPETHAPERATRSRPQAAATPSPAEPAAPSVSMRADSPPSMPGKTPSPQVRSADENAKDRARILAANAGPALVTSLGGRATESDSDERSDSKTGTLSIHSSKRGTVYLYPDKTVLGETPLDKVRLPVGKHKLKLQIGPSKGQRKYIQVHITAGDNVLKNFTHWRD